MNKEKIFSQFNENLFNRSLFSPIRIYKLFLPSYSLPEQELPEIIIADSCNRILNVEEKNFLPHYAPWFYLAKADRVNNTIQYRYDDKKNDAKLLKTARVQTFTPYNDRDNPIPIIDRIDNKQHYIGTVVFKAAEIYSWDIKHHNFSNIKKRNIVLYEIEKSREISSEKHPELIDMLKKYSVDCSKECNKITEEYTNKFKQEILNNQNLFPV